MENPETFCRRSIHLADQMAGNPAADRRRGGMEPQCLLQNPVAHPVRRSDFVLRKVHRGETKISGDTGILVTLLIGRTRMRQLLTVILGYVQILGHILTAWVRHQADVQYRL